MPEGALERVLMTGDTVGGVWTFVLDLAQALGEQGVEVLLAAMGREPSEQQHTEAREIQKLRLATSSYKVEWMDNPRHDVANAGRWLLDLDRQFKPDVIHLNTLGHGALPFSSPKVMTFHSCVLSWWAAVKHEPLPATWDRYRREVTKSVRAVDFLAAPSQSMLRTISEYYGPELPPSRAVVNGRVPSMFRPGEKQPFILSAGRLWDEGKNIATLANAASSLPWPVYLAGEERSPEGEIANLAGCRPLGRLAALELAEWYSHAAIYALPARYEPFGLSVLEAAMAGGALVLGDIESLRELWHGAAIFVPPDDVDGLTAALLELIESSALREEMSRRSLARAGTYKLERMAAGYADIYASVARQRVACSL